MTDPANHTATPDFNDPIRYSRQTLFTPFGSDGQQRLSQSSALLVGCGALGAAQAELLVRAGIGRIRLVDRDIVELSNLPRQMLYDENDVRDNLPKAEAAARKLRRINSNVTITSDVADVNYESIAYFADGADIILDGTDNLLTRYLINDYAVKTATPWIYGGALAAQGRVMPIIPSQTPCLRCVFEPPAQPGDVPTCETAGVIGPIVTTVAAVQAAEAIKILSGNQQAIRQELLSIDLWDNRIRTLAVPRDPQCHCCVEHQFDFLAGAGELSSISLCGRNSVQIRPREKTALDLPRLAEKYQSVVPLRLNQFMLKLTVEDKEITLFPDGRAIIAGTNNIEKARSLYAHYVGH